MQNSVELGTSHFELKTDLNKKQNQDTSIVLQNFMGIQDNWIFGVFDGHGVNGAKVSNMVRELISEYIKKGFQKAGHTFNSDEDKHFNTVTAWFSERNVITNKLEKYQNLKTRGKVIEEAFNNAQRDLK